MNQPTHILAVLDRSHLDTRVVAKAAHLASRCGARLELFVCDAEHAYAMKHEYEPSRNVEFRRDCLDRVLAYLQDVRGAVKLPDQQVRVSAACESPLYEGIVRMVEQSHADLVIKAAGGLEEQSKPVFDSNDWQLMRKCPATLLMTRGCVWPARLRVAAAIDVSAEETTGLAGSILRAAGSLCAAHEGELEVVYSAPAGISRQARSERESMLRYLTQRSSIERHSVHLLDGAPESTLPVFAADRQYDVVVMGALNHRPGAVALVGSLTSRLMDSIDCDFLLVKAERAA